MNVFDLYAKIRLEKDELEKGLAESEKDVSKFGETVKKGFITIAKVGAAAFTAAGAAVTKFAKDGVEAYAEYEQLVGGVETLFKTSADIVQNYASNAFKTAGLSANEYMETVTSFSASLLQSLGGDTEKAADVANTAIVDMSDNANKMGTAMESIQNAYQGFAKQNYTMLDNLKLGYGGTKTEMERLISDANAVKEANGEMADLSIESFADVVEAIHIVQTEMGVTGTTAKEASTTIEGSLNSAKAAWQNMVAGFANENANMEQLVNQFVESAGTAAENILPRVTQALQGIGQVIEQLAPIIAEEVPKLIESVLPSILSAGASVLSALVKGITNALPELSKSVLSLVKSLISSLSENFPSIMEQGAEVLGALISGIVEALPMIGEMLITLVESFAEYLSEHGDEIFEQGAVLLKTLIEGISESLPNMVESIVGILTTIIQILTDNLPTILEQGTSILMSLINGIVAAIPTLTAALPQIINAIVNFLISAIPQIISTGITLISALVQALPTIIQNITAVIPDIIKALVNAIIDGIPQIVQGGIDLITSLIDDLPTIINTIVGVIPGLVGDLADALIDEIPQIIDAGVDLLVSLVKDLPKIIFEIVKKVPEIVDGIVDKFGDLLYKMKDVGKRLIEGMWEGIKSLKDWLWDKVKSFCESIWNGIKDFFGISSPSKEMKWIGSMLIEGLAGGIDSEKRAAIDAVDEIGNAVMDEFDKAITPPEIGISASGDMSLGTYNVQTSGGSDIGSKLDSIIYALSNLTNMNIVLNSGVLVGELASDIDRELGIINAQRERSVI